MTSSTESSEHGEPQTSVEKSSTAALRLTALAQRQGAELSVEEDGFEFFKSENPEELLEQITGNGYLLHGTTRRIQGDLIPHQANDTVKESGNRTAIYLTNIVPIAMFKALSGGVHQRGMTQHGVSSELNDGKRTYTNLHFASSRLDKIAEAGFVYVFDPSNIEVEQVNGEFLSYDRATPVAVIRVLRGQFQYPIEDLQPQTR